MPTSLENQNLASVVSGFGELLSRKALFIQGITEGVQDNFSAFLVEAVQLEQKIASFKIEQDKFSDTHLSSEIESYEHFVEHLSTLRERFKKLREDFSFKTQGKYPYQESEDRINIYMESLFYQAFVQINFLLKSALSYIWTRSNLEARNKEKLSLSVEKLQKEVNLEIKSIKYLRQQDKWREENTQLAQEREEYLKQREEDHNYGSGGMSCGA